MHPSLLLVPDFATILLGAGLRRWLPLSDEFWTGMEKLIYYVLFPTLLFSVLTKTKMDLATATPLVLTGLSATLAGMLLALPAARLFTRAPMAFASRFQCAFRFNSYIGVA